MKKKILCGILTQGDISSELSTVARAIENNPDYDVQVEFFNEKPISQNRNMIVQKFLAGDWDYLMMIDSDIVPPSSVINLVDYEKDIIGALCFMWQGAEIMPVAFNRTPDGMYRPIKPEECDGVTEVDAIGTGCIVLSRKVLEQVKSPFSNLYDADGIKIFGLDINFCRKAKELGFKVFINTDYLCDHYTRVNLRKFYAIIYGQRDLIKKQEEEIKKLKQNENL